MALLMATCGDTARCDARMKSRQGLCSKRAADTSHGNNLMLLLASPLTISTDLEQQL